MASAAESTAFTTATNAVWTGKGFCTFILPLLRTLSFLPSFFPPPSPPPSPLPPPSTHLNIRKVIDASEIPDHTLLSHNRIQRNIGVHLKFAERVGIAGLIADEIILEFICRHYRHKGGETINRTRSQTCPTAMLRIAVEPPNKGHICGSAILSTVGRLSSLKRLDREVCLFSGFYRVLYLECPVNGIKSAAIVYRNIGWWHYYTGQQ